MNITWKGSPNFNDSTYRKPINRVVLHWFGVGTLDGANTRFQNAANQVSAHYGISDDTVYQWVKEEEVAWHAGNFPMNQCSIGIEHDATTTKNASEKTYQTAGQLLAEICKRHDIPLDRTHIIGHKEVVPTQCPGTLDIDRIISIAKSGEQNIIDKLTNELNSLQVKYNELQTKYTSDLAEKQLHIESLQKSSSEMTAQLTLARQAVESARKDLEAKEEAFQALQDQVSDFMEKIIELEGEIQFITKQLSTANEKVVELQNKLDVNLKGYSKWELLVQLFFGKR